MYAGRWNVRWQPAYLNGTGRVLLWHCRVGTRSQTADSHEVRGESQTETSRRVSPVNLLHGTKKYLGRGIRDKCGWIGVLKQVQKDGSVGDGGRNKNWIGMKSCRYSAAYRELGGKRPSERFVFKSVIGFRQAVSSFARNLLLCL